MSVAAAQATLAARAMAGGLASVARATVPALAVPMRANKSVGLPAGGIRSMSSPTPYSCACAHPSHGAKQSSSANPTETSLLMSTHKV